MMADDPIQEEEGVIHFPIILFLLLLDRLNVVMYLLVPWRLVADIRQEGSGALRVVQEILKLKGFSVRQWRSL